MMSDATTIYDFLVIGGGVIGTAVARCGALFRNDIQSDSQNNVHARIIT